MEFFTGMDETDVYVKARLSFVRPSKTGFEHKQSPSITCHTRISAGPCGVFVLVFMFIEAHFLVAEDTGVTPFVVQPTLHIIRDPLE